MKKILQVKKRRVAPSSATTRQKTLHPLFVCSSEQRTIANQNRLNTLLRDCPWPKTVGKTVRTRRTISVVNEVPDLFRLARGDIEHSFVVPGFEEYFKTKAEEKPVENRRKHHRSSSKKGSPRVHEKPFKISVESVRHEESPSFSKASPATTTTTTATTSDQRIPEISALKEIITNHQVPSMIPFITEKSPSCTPTHSIAPPLPSDLDRRVLDWVDNCLSQDINNANNDHHQTETRKEEPLDESLLNELQRSYLRLVDSEDCSDLVVETADRPIRAHKVILFIRCKKIAQTLSADSSCWPLKWCSSKAALYFLRYIYSADISFVPGLDGQVRKDLLTLCCQYQTDELAARLIRDRSPSPSQLTQKSQTKTRKRSDTKMASENQGPKKTRMSITCETVSITVPDDSRHSIQQSPRLPQSFPAFQQSTPFITRISDDDKQARGSETHPIDLNSSSSDLFTDEDVQIVQPLSPIQTTPRRSDDDDRCNGIRTKYMQRKSLSQPAMREDSRNSDHTPKRSRLIDGLDITPLPQYSTMKTPEMHQHLDRFGIKAGIGKQKAVKLLKHIYKTMHPQEDSQKSSESEDSDSGDLPLEETVNCDDNDDQDVNVEEKISRFIQKNPELYEKILRFEPLEVSEFKSELRKQGIRVNDKTLLNYLDYHCVNISFGTQRKASRSPKKTKRKRFVRKQIFTQP